MWAGYTSFTPSGEQPDQVTCAVTQPEPKMTVHREVPMRPEIAYVTKSAVAEIINQEKTKITTSHRQATWPPVLPVSENDSTAIVKQKTTKCLQNQVVLKRSTHAPADTPKGVVACNYCKRKANGGRRPH